MKLTKHTDRNNHHAQNDKKIGVRVYLDYAASTPVDKEVLQAMLPFMARDFGNPNSVHTEGKAGAKAVRESRKEVAQELGTEEDEIIFTGSGTEGNNIAIQGVVREAKKHLQIPHIITSQIEHSSVENVFKALSEEGIDSDFCGVDADGILNKKQLQALLRDETVLVSVMLVNNEIGVIEPIEEISRIIADFRKSKGGKSVYPLLHVDAAQAPLFLDIDVKKLGADFLTIDAQKIYGPKGVGALYIRRGVEIEPILFGGGHEKGIRPGTQNVAGIAALAKALKLAGERREKDNRALRELQNYFFEKIEKEIPEAVVNGSLDKRVPNNINVSIAGIEGDYLAVALDKKGIAVSSVSACHSGVGGGSHVVKALSADDLRARSAIRFTMGRETTKKDINKAIEALKEIAVH